MNLPIDKITTDKTQPRKTFEDLESLAETIKNEGLLQPILVDQNYKLIDGERRFRASKIAGLTEVPVTVLHVKDESKRLIWQLLDDIQHKDFPIMERDQAWFRLWKELKMPTHQKLADILGVDKSTVGDAIERAEFVPKVDAKTLDIKTDNWDLTKFLKKEPKLREKALEKMSQMGTTTHKAVFAERLKKAKAVSEEKFHEVLDEPYTPYTKRADRIIDACKTIVENLDHTLIINIPPQQGFILMGYISELKKHLKIWDATEGEIV